jgi:CheY-like chemotaxis protein
MARGGFFAVDSLRGVHVLVVDDEPECRDLLTAILEYGGALVTAVGSVREALGLMALIKPDLLLADLVMEDEDGFALIRQVRALKPDDGGMVPAVAVSVLAAEADCERARGAGFDAFVTKPLDPWELCRLISALLSAG